MTNTPGLHGQDRKILQRHAHTRTAEQVFRTDWVNSLEITAGLPNCIYGPMIETAVPAQTSLSVRGSLRRRCGSGHQKKLRAVVQMKILAGGIDDGRRLWCCGSRTQADPSQAKNSATVRSQSVR